ncbi:gliding motility-associated ABC transporter substrate-binding protein GldG [Spongiimicrobium salis]|uniref:gliding motility-associated ABC transporter substrate-binding protein GldG n=1 Tax=Spongiimicrobium salis TaxID=1667022 RepID=UPI00374D3229
MKKKSSAIGIAIIAFVIINLLGSLLYTRFDLTEDKRYTLSPSAITTVDRFEKPIIIDVLLDGNLPPEFARLKVETQQILEEFASQNNNIKFNFFSPLDEEPNREQVIGELQSIGLTPANVTVEENGKVSQEIVFPWAMVNSDSTTVKVSLLKNKLGASSEELVNNSVQHLEYAFSDAFSKLDIPEKKKVAVLKGNGELEDIFMADFLSTINEYYDIGAITLDSVSSNPQQVFDQLRDFDLALIAKPTEAFSDAEKYILDQYIVQGGKSMWLIDQVSAELDSLYNETGSTFAVPRDLNLTDFFFKYGVRFNPVLVNDLYFTEIILAKGEGNGSQYSPVPWYYHPKVFSRNDHPINTNLEALQFQFANTLDTLRNANTKTILYRSSPLSKVDAAPRRISFDILNAPPDRTTYNNGNQPMAVLIEGEFNSAFTNRSKPVSLEGSLNQGAANKMLVVADGDIIKNQVSKGRPLELGYDKWTNKFYGNKEFMINSMNYLLEDNGLINIRSKKVAIPFLDQEKVVAQKTKWQFLNIGLPVVLTCVVGLLFSLYRRKKYSK